MKRLLPGLLATLFATGAFAQMTPPGQPFAPTVLNLGEDFRTLFISCGTPVTPTCPQTLAPLEHAALLHYVTLGGRSTDTCSGWLAVSRTTALGTQRYELMRLVLGAGAVDNIVLTLPKPIRLEAGDVVELYRAQGTCAVLADLGIETVE